MHKEQITRLYKSNKSLKLFWVKHSTRKDFRNKSFSPFLMLSSKGRTKIRRNENRKFRRDKFNISNWKKFGVNYRRQLF